MRGIKKNTVVRDIRQTYRQTNKQTEIATLWAKLVKRDPIELTKTFSSIPIYVVKILSAFDIITMFVKFHTVLNSNDCYKSFAKKQT